MAVKVGDSTYDGMKEACAELGVSRNTLLRYIKEGLVQAPPTERKGRTKYRYFTDEWYEENRGKIYSTEEEDGPDASDVEDATAESDDLQGQSDVSGK